MEEVGIPEKAFVLRLEVHLQDIEIFLLGHHSLREIPLLIQLV
jgi:hypothetical protein